MSVDGVFFLVMFANVIAAIFVQTVDLGRPSEIIASVALLAGIMASVAVIALGGSASLVLVGVMGLVVSVIAFGPKTWRYLTTMPASGPTDDYPLE